MKREHHPRHHQQQQHSGPPPSSTMAGKSSIFSEVEDADADGEVDELLAALGYKVRSSDMADVALKLEQLDRAMASTSSPAASHQDDAFLLSHLASDTVHYNPSDLSSWLESMLSEIDAPLPLPPPPPSDVSPGSERDRKRIKTSADVTTTTTSSSSSSSSSSLPLFVVDSQEAGIRLVHTLIACAESVQHQNYAAADALVKQVAVLAASQGGAMRKVAGYFAEALARRIYKLPHQQDSHSLDAAISDLLRVHFYESCPYLKFAHFTANQAILEAFSGFRRVHVIDFGMNQGMQWPALLQALAVRPEGPPSFRLTGIGRPQPDNTDALQEVGLKLAQLAETIHVDFEYRGFVANSLADLEPYLLQSNNEGEGEIEAVAVNSVLELHGLLAFPGAIEKVLGTVRAIKPKIVTLVEQEANHNAGPFVDRFNEALHYYSTMFDSLEGGSGGSQDNVMSEVYLGREICNVVACEGTERTERHETLIQWRKRFVRAGFEPVHLGSNAYRLASLLLALFAGGDGYRVEENDGCLTLGWHTRPLIATSAWRIADSEQAVYV